ncbi:MAG: hypothetical protein R2824_09770 [Saprospiraceae bacterium]|nr:polyprenyl synthetase family protein [Lewinella sp.]
MHRVNPSDSQDRLETKKALASEYRNFQKKTLIDSSHHPYFQILDEKILQENCGIRALFARRMSDYLLEASNKLVFTKEEKSFFHRQLPFILESAMAIQYYHNQILDEKSDVSFQEPESVKQNLIIGNLLERELFNYVLEQVDEAWKKKTYLFLMRVFQAVDIGQKLERATNLFTHFERGLSVDHAFEKKINRLGIIDADLLDTVVQGVIQCFDIPPKCIPFLYRYFERLYLISSVLFVEAAEFIADLLGLTRRFKVRKQIRKFAGYFGLMMQVINDVNDCSLIDHCKDTAGKLADDAFADLKNRILTFPLLHHFLHQPNGQVGKFIRSERKTIKPGEIESYYREMMEHRSQFHGIAFGRMLRDKAVTYLIKKNVHRSYIIDLCTIADTNQYYTCLYRERTIYKAFKKERKQFLNSRKKRCNQWHQ